MVIARVGIPLLEIVKINRQTVSPWSIGLPQSSDHVPTRPNAWIVDATVSAAAEAATVIKPAVATAARTRIAPLDHRPHMRIERGATSCYDPREIERRAL